MEGCLTGLIKLIILAGLFCLGLVAGYMYYQGVFDPPLVNWAYQQIGDVSPAEASRRVDPLATPELAASDFSKVDRRYVRWRGQISEIRNLTPTLTGLNLLAGAEPRRMTVVFANRPLDSLGVRVGDEVEVLGYARRLLVPSEDREGHRFPQVLALEVKKVDRGAPAGASPPATGEASPGPSPGPVPSPASTSPASPSPGVRRPAHP